MANRQHFRNTISSQNETPLTAQHSITISSFEWMQWNPYNVQKCILSVIQPIKLVYLFVVEVELSKNEILMAVQLKHIFFLCCITKADRTWCAVSQPAYKIYSTYSTRDRTRSEKKKLWARCTSTYIRSTQISCCLRSDNKFG